EAVGARRRLPAASRRALVRHPAGPTALGHRNRPAALDGASPMGGMAAAMNTAARKSSTTSAQPTQAAPHSFVSRSGSAGFFAPAVQLKMTVNQPGDKFEQEADKMAEKVMRMPTPASAQKEEKPPLPPGDKPQRKEDDRVQK